MDVLQCMTLPLLSIFISSYTARSQIPSRTFEFLTLFPGNGKGNGSFMANYRTR